MRPALALLATLALCLPAAAKEQPVTRADLARSYQRFERALSAHPEVYSGRKAQINRAFDQATVAFFSGAYPRAIRALDGLTESLTGTAPPAAGLSLRILPSRWAPSEGAPRPTLEGGAKGASPPQRREPRGSPKINQYR